MNITLKELKDIFSENCITIIISTHRTNPDYLKDEVNLKNQIKEVERRIMADTTKRHALKLMDKLHALAEEIDHSHNLESLLLFVNDDMAEYTRLPIKVEDRVVIDDTFATRDLVRAMHIESGYYVLVLSQDKARLIEAMNNKVVKEFGAPFPFKNDLSPSRHRGDHPVATRQLNLMGEFFNRIDKEVNKIRNVNPLPVMLCTVEENYNQYMKVADQKHSIYETFLNSNRTTEKSQAIVIETGKIIEEYRVNNNDARKAELEKAVSANKFLSDTNEISRAIKAGKIQTLFIEQGLFQPAVMEGDEIVYVSDDKRSDKGIIDDIYDELIEANMRFGGDVVFLPKGELKKFNGFGAITRY